MDKILLEELTPENYIISNLGYVWKFVEYTKGETTIDVIDIVENNPMTLDIGFTTSVPTVTEKYAKWFVANSFHKGTYYLSYLGMPSYPWNKVEKVITYNIRIKALKDGLKFQGTGI